MPRRNKLIKFAELGAFRNVLENMDSSKPGIYDEAGNLIDLRGRWREYFFKNNLPIVLELACGRGEYSIGLALTYPHKNFLGIDVKGARIWKGAKYALDFGIKNAGFFRTRIEQLGLFFGKEEVDEIWIIFPDPLLNSSKSNRRLTASNFLEVYSKILKKGGYIHLKTDNQELYDFTLSEIQKSPMYQIEENIGDIYDGRKLNSELEIKTYYEKSHLQNGRVIRYIKWQLKA
jgi:tRNA (guanine-N7-)-methyltransferase